ncbi:single-stranded DNA-binding protein [Membranicola marinus]|uniref:Single-stranded DNA-binding protein n=1 Tax=Membranihabitans marinus TaxID=1227546 RepID=A0A953LD28_9BACT|nr:single-stranded DNA-binding protein [Membranihabitans marinus]MBY5960131.1 single-stranded DNA-binding protein [Membranihabitans marinus]
MKNVRNQVQIIGRLGRDVELKTTQGDKKLANMNVAVNRYYTNAIGQKVENTDWFRVVAWGKMAENMANILHKGDEVMIQGRLATRSYEDKNKILQYVTEIVAEQFLFITSPKQVVAS